MEPTKPIHPLLTLPSAVVIAGAIIAIAIIWVKKPVTAPVVANDTGQQEVIMAPVTGSDHILGNPAAPIMIVEYSDPSCPYCKLFNPTMEQLMSAYGPGGKVAWVYRHYPLDKPAANGDILHPNAGTEAQAMECAASLGGNDKFWKYEEAWYRDIPNDAANRSAADDQKQMLQDAKIAGLDAVAFNDCLTSGQFKDKVNAQYLDGINAGVSGTPFSFIITPSGTKIPLAGVQTYTTLKAAVDALVAEVK